MKFIPTLLSYCFMTSKPPSAFLYKGVPPCLVVSWGFPGQLVSVTADGSTAMIDEATSQ